MGAWLKVVVYLEVPFLDLIPCLVASLPLPLEKANSVIVLLLWGGQVVAPLAVYRPG